MEQLVAKSGTTANKGFELPGTAGDALPAAVAWLRGGQPVVLATVADTWGSAPVPAGGRMAVTTGDVFAGSVSGGCVEADVVAAAPEIIADGRPRLFSFGVEDETAWRVGLPCGGRIKVLAELFRPGEDLALLERMANVATSRQGLVVRTDLTNGERTSFDSDDRVPIGLRDLVRDTPCALVSSGSDTAFVAAVRPPARIVIIGASRLGQLLVQFARLAGFGVSVIDPRETFATTARFPDLPSRDLIADWPDAALARVGLDHQTAVVALSHVKDIDDAGLKIALASPCIYVGALGSKRNAATRRERLLATGVDEASLARLRSPVGLDIGAKTPEEIAVSVVAEIIAAMRGKRPTA